MVDSILASSNENSVDGKVGVQRDSKRVIGTKIGGTCNCHRIEVAVYIILVVVLFDLDEIPWVILVRRGTAVDPEILSSILEIAATRVTDVGWSQDDVRLVYVCSINTVLRGMDDGMGRTAVRNLACPIVASGIGEEGVRFY